MIFRSLVVVATVCSACKPREEQAPPPPPAAKSPVRGAVGDSDLRVMLAEVASTKACDMVRGNFRALFAPDRRDTVTGVLWIRDCQITNDGTKVRFELSGNGWQWIDQTKKQAGGKFVVRQYVTFGVKVVLPGALDMAYDRHAHVMSLWFTPSETPHVTFAPVGKVDVDEKGLWSSVIGGVSSIFDESPDEQGAHEAKKQGTGQFANELADGMTVAIDLCTGYQRFSLGRAQKGSLGKPNPGDSRKVPTELQPGALFVFGTYLAKNGMNIDVESTGAMHVALACTDQAELAADAFVQQRPLPLIKTLAEADVRGKGHLKIKPTSCKVAVIARAIEPTAVTFDWQRPRGEAGRSTGGPAIHCGVSSPSGAPRPVAARRR